MVMGLMPLRSSLFEVTGVLFLIVCLLCIRLLRRRSLLLLLVWPVLIYFWGPTITSLFANAPVLRRYVFMSSLIPETLLMFIYVAGLCCLDYFFNLSHSIRKCVSSPSVVGLARSPIFLPIYLATTALAVTLQLVILHRFGSALGGGPYVMSLVSEGYIPYWGFLAGLYEIIFLFVVLYLLSGQRSRLRFLVLGLYVFAAALRLAGGTRLILVKEIAVILIIAHAQGRIKTRKLLLTGALVVVLGSVVGLLRSSGANPFAFLGPIYGLVMESGLNALTLNIAYQVQHSVYMASHSQVVSALEFVLLTSIPSFLRFGVTKTALHAMSPYHAALGYGFDTATPVGGMSGFATISYIFGYPFFSTAILVVSIASMLKMLSRTRVGNILILVFCINAIHFWRDPIDIAAKNMVQDFIFAAALLVVPRLRGPAVLQKAKVLKSGSEVIC